MIVCLVNQRESLTMITVGALSHEAPIVLLPFQKTVPGSLVALQQSNNDEKKGSLKKPINGIKTPSGKIEKQHSKKQTKEKVSGTTLVDAKNKVGAQKNLQPKKPEIKKNIPQKIKPAPQKELKKPDALTDQLVTASINQNLVHQAQEHASLLDTKATDSIIYVGLHDLELLDLHSDVQQELEKWWNPPVGLPDNVECVMKVVVDQTGNVVDILIEKKSAVISYDIAARAAVSQASFPKQVWGKAIMITFKE